MIHTMEMTEEVLVDVDEIKGEATLCETSGQRENKKKEANGILTSHSLEPWESLLENIRDIPSLPPEEVYSIYKFELLQNIHLGLLKLVKTTLLPFYSSHC